MEYIDIDGYSVLYLCPDGEIRGFSCDSDAWDNEDETGLTE